MLTNTPGETHAAAGKALNKMMPILLLLIISAVSVCSAENIKGEGLESFLDQGDRFSGPERLREDPRIALLDLARERFEAGHWQEATPPLQSLLALDKDNPEAHGILGALSALTGRRDQAEQELAFLEQRSTHSLYRRLIRAVLLAQAGDYQGAEVQLRDAGQERPDHPVLLYYQGSLNLARNRLDKAQESFEAVIAGRPTFSWALAGLGQVFRRKGQLDQAAVYYEKSLNILPEVTPYRRELLEIYMESGRSADAEKAVKDLLYFTPGVKEAHLTRGMEMLSSGSYRSAVEEMDRLIEIYQRIPQAFYIRAAALINLNQASEALEDIRAYIGLQWGVPQAHHYAGMCYLALGERDLAEHHFQRVIMLNPGMGRSFVVMTVIEQMRGDYQRALQGLALARQGGEPTELVDFLAAHMLLASGQKEKYIQAMRGALGLVPGLSEEVGAGLPPESSYKEFGEDRNLMVIYFLNAWYDLSLNHCSRLLALNPKDRFALYYKALAYIAQKKHKDAGLAFQGLLEVEPGVIAGHMGLGRVSLEAGETEKAIQSFQRAAALDPNYTSAFLGLGDALLKNKQEDEALRAYKEAARLEPSMPAPYIRLAGILAEKPDRIEEAEEYALKAASLSPEDPYVLDALGWVKVQQGKSLEALEALTKSAESSGGDPVLLYHLGIAYYKAGNIDDAEKALKKTLSLSTDFPGAQRAGAVLDEIGSRD
ncbi:MAG: tetratricopeptide repeat protein [Desulfobacteraceae bacterium]